MHCWNMLGPIVTIEPPVSYLLILILSPLVSLKSVSFGGEDKEIFRNVHLCMQALSRSLTFFRENHELLTIDALFGLRSAEGFLKNLLEEHEARFVWESEIRDRVHNLYNTATRISGNSMTSLLKEPTPYVQTFKEIVREPWFFDNGQRTINRLLLSTRAPAVFDVEELLKKDSDVCMSGLLGSQEGQRTNCFVSRSCWDLMTKADTAGYWLTHQGLYFLLAKKRGPGLISAVQVDMYGSHLKLVAAVTCQNLLTGCEHVIAAKAGFDNFLEERLFSIGSNVAIQMQHIALMNFPPGSKDLFLEQSLLCGWLGFEECFADSLFAQILTWQDESGCFKELKTKQPVLEGNAVSVSRKLLMELELDGGCLTHTSGLAVAVFAQYLHWFLTKRHDFRPHSFSSPLLRMVYQWLAHRLSLVLLVALGIAILILKRRLRLRSYALHGSLPRSRNRR